MPFFSFCPSQTLKLIFKFLISWDIPITLNHNIYLYIISYLNIDYLVFAVDVPVPAVVVAVVLVVVVVDAGISCPVAAPAVALNSHLQLYCLYGKSSHTPFLLIKTERCCSAYPLSY